MNMNEKIFYGSYGDMWQRVLDMARRMPDVDAIAGVPVSGLASAGMLSAATGIKAVPLDAVPDGVRRLLVLEDASGFMKCKTARMGAAHGRDVFYGAVYACDKAAEEMELIGCVAPKPRVFTWNLTKSDKARMFAYDLDGVFCRNPTREEIMDRQRYVEFLRRAEQIRVAPSLIGWIVTGRMEQYRRETEEWLAAHGIRYIGLDMAPDNQVHTVVGHAERKADWYRKSDAILFVESNPRQAEIIADHTGRAVVCAETEECWHTAEAVPVEIRSVSKNTKIIYTISTGEYEKFAPIKYIPPEGWDYRVLTSADCPAYLSPKQQAAWAKINAPRIFRDYELSLGIDDDMTVLKDPCELFDGRADFCALMRENIPTWMADLELVVKVRQAITADVAQAEINRLKRMGMKDSRVWLSGILWRRHTPDVIRICDAWWTWYSMSETQRDQPALAVACQSLGVELDAITEEAALGYIKHDYKKADRDGVRIRADANAKPNATEKHMRRRGDRK